MPRISIPDTSSSDGESGVVEARRTALTAPAGPVEQERSGSTTLPDRYEDLRLLGSGGFGEVRRVRDRMLDRVVAMKILLPGADPSGAIRARFLAEIKLTADLQHPGIVAIHDFGELADGRLWYTMLEVRGRTLRAILDEAFNVTEGGARWSRRRLLDAFARICETMGYAHSRGVIHRDLKPENIMIGEFGQVMVMDWGLARRVHGAAEDPTRPARPEALPESEDVSLTRLGDVLGTPAYMPPEQARGEVHRHGPAADVYSLGAILFHLLAGKPPFADLGPLAYRRLVSGDPPRLSEAAAGDVPGDLVAICERAMAREPEDRHADAAKLAVEITAFLDGARRRERALSELEKANATRPEIVALRARAESRRAEARSLLSSVRPSDPVEKKLPGWQYEDEAERLEREASLLETNWIQGMHGALTIDPDLPEAHALLADHYTEKLLDAERGRREGEVARFEVLLRAHDRGRHVAILSGKGALSLVTDPEGARVTLYRYTMFQRRLVPELVGDLGVTPLVEVPLDKGSHLLVLDAPGYETVKYPVLIERGEPWNGCPPGGREPHPIKLPRVGELFDDEVYVPAGYTWTGGDPEAPDSFPRRRLWLDAFVIGRYPVTNEAYLAFLNDLVRAGREAEALGACPRTNPGTRSGAGEALSYARRADGLFVLREDDPGETWQPRGPAVLMDWRGAMEYARWLSIRTRKPYRLVHEIEREKATRGVDGRAFPWGNHFDPTFACMLSSHTGDPGRVEVSTYPLDEGPYGMRGGAGNSRDFCANVWTFEGPRIEEGRLIAEVATSEDPGYRSVRGGAWSSVENHCRAAARFALRPDQRRSAIGLRVGRTFA
ncbi:SUMF1/EgtB/PvdO family nonheme iron enzyme [Polyangium sp. y55x31]|uniref:protein kinase domain-containing protein n=1 Tax=Polyangium sp. y55x31 TaxID=3042688 RepID=UPI002482EC58|nr:SUMF1/EgtB/PvdO family nonheme iron enzyme [Polyangium sp. y55x31]MDI1476504.1 SUMF1/EgtB/PvdO family nonheme iron enzyme [Polyangium sp. y55x31]